MSPAATTPAAYLDSLPAERKAAMKKLRAVLNKHLPKGFEERVAGGMLHWVVPLSRFPAGYHCTPGQPLPFLSLASQKNYIALYHLGIYADPKLLAWFQKAWPEHVSTKLDMGKSCIRFKKLEQIPYELIGQLVARMSPDQWVKLYEEAVRR